MNPARSLILLFILAGFRLPLSAQLPDGGTSWVDVTPPPGAIALEVSDLRRPVSDGDVGTSLDALQVLAVGQVELAGGLTPRVELGWHDPELREGSSRGGVVWGLGVAVRPFRFPLRSDPEAGPRDWLATVVDLSYRAGEASASTSDLSWGQLQGYLGLEWHKVVMGTVNAPMGAATTTAAAGLLWNSLDAEQGAFDGSGDQDLGVRFQVTSTLARNQFVKLEADFYGSSDRVLSLTAGQRF